MKVFSRKIRKPAGMRAETIGRARLSQPARGALWHRDASMIRQATALVTELKREGQEMVACDDPDRVPRDDSRAIGSSSAGGANIGKSPADPRQQRVADLAIGRQLLLAIALGAGRIVGR